MFISGAKCDKCSAFNYAKSIQTKKMLTASLRKEGWSIGKRTICPKCKPEPRKIILE